MDFWNLLKEFDEYKTKYDFTDYIKDMNNISKELEHYKRETALKLISDLSYKYEIGLNEIAYKLGTGKTTYSKEKSFKIRSPFEKSDVQLKIDLEYIHSCIIVIALVNQGVKKIAFGKIE
ncbi:MAG: hypothetical protein R3Y35_05180 [Clostridia bacterium]